MLLLKREAAYLCQCDSQIIVCFLKRTIPGQGRHMVLGTPVQCWIHALAYGGARMPLLQAAQCTSHGAFPTNQFTIQTRTRFTVLRRLQFSLLLFLSVPLRDLGLKTDADKPALNATVNIPVNI